MTITATIKGAEKGGHRLAFYSPLRIWHGVDIQHLTSVKVDKHLVSYADKRGHKVENSERDPGVAKVLVAERNGNNHVADFEITESTVNGVEIPVGSQSTSASGVVIFERT